MLGSGGGGGCNGLVNQPRRTSVWTCLPGYRENLPRLNVSSSLHDKNTNSHLRINNHSGFGEKTVVSVFVPNTRFLHLFSLETHYKLSPRGLADQPTQKYLHFLFWRRFERKVVQDIKCLFFFYIFSNEHGCHPLYFTLQMQFHCDGRWCKPRRRKKANFQHFSLKLWYFHLEQTKWKCIFHSIFWTGSELSQGANIARSLLFT